MRLNQRPGSVVITVIIFSTCLFIRMKHLPLKNKNKKKTFAFGLQKLWHVFVVIAVFAQVRAAGVVVTCSSITTVHYKVIHYIGSEMRRAFSVTRVCVRVTHLNKAKHVG